MHFTNNPLISAQMKRNQLRNRFIKNIPEFNKNAYNAYKVYLFLRKTKKAYCANLDEKGVIDNK